MEDQERVSCTLQKCICLRWIAIHGPLVHSLGYVLCVGLQILWLHMFNPLNHLSTAHESVVLAFKGTVVDRRKEFCEKLCPIHLVISASPSPVLSLDLLCPLDHSTVGWPDIRLTEMRSFSIKPSYTIEVNWGPQSLIMSSRMPKYWKCG